MGIILQAPITTPQGMDLSNVYISFASNPLVICPEGEGSAKTFTTRCHFNMYVDRTCRNADKKYIDSQSITVVSNTITSPYACLYEQLKIAYPDSVDS